MSMRCYCPRIRVPPAVLGFVTASPPGAAPSSVEVMDGGWHNFNCTRKVHHRLDPAPQDRIHTINQELANVKRHMLQERAESEARLRTAHETSLAVTLTLALNPYLEGDPLCRLFWTVKLGYRQGWSVLLPGERTPASPFGPIRIAQSPLPRSLWHHLGSGHIILWLGICKKLGCDSL